ncbi:hypothetical protein Q8A67_002928 [Cirrhinus molitorella]|uniref:Uncharacterized protein n=1 Tax=Cirrhinus molitorella TaxID=172907 RepID=A0AA88Q9W0_9TELE|nr:hypothetical protein Q8A67_002928 [Cirrhinus molitorella]
MSLSDVLFHGNPERREKIIRKSQELIELMKSNFEATNSLTEIVNQHLGSSFRPITLNEKATVKENCDVMIKHVNQIQAKVEQVDKELKEKLDPTLYERLQKIPLHGFKNIPAAILGYYERDKLEAALAEYDKTLADFRPASKEYQEAIYEVKFTVKQFVCT